MVSSRTRKTTNVGNYLNDLDSRATDNESQIRSVNSEYQTYEDRIVTLEDQVENLSSVNYREQQELATSGSLTALALLDPAYRAPGPAKVAFFTEGTNTLNALSGVFYQWLGTPRRTGNRVVEMTNLNGTWYILGHSGREQYGGKVRLPLGAGLNTYNKQLTVDSWSEPRALRSSAGIVVLGGMIAFGVGATSGLVLTTLPAGHRPDTDMLVQVNYSGTARLVRISASTGQIQVYGSAWPVGTNDWVSLDGISFPAADVATWTNISTWQNGWGPHAASATYGAPGYWKDPYGIVWFRGLVAGGTATEDATMFTMPTGYQQHLQSHVVTGSGGGGVDGFGYISAFPSTATPAGKVAWKNGSQGNTYMSLAGRFTIITPEALSGMYWSESGYIVSGWANYNVSSFPSLGVAIRPDGIAMAQGLINSGAMGQRASNVGPHALPEKTLLYPIASNAAFGRLDIGGNQGATDNSGIIVPQVGSNGWVSLDGLKWMVE